jgi:hypothetical protein
MRASQAYIMARQLGCDAPPMAGITATQTVLAADHIDCLGGAHRGGGNGAVTAESVWHYIQKCEWRYVRY